MKKKLLTVVLSVVMIFGVFGLTGCAGKNPADDYNYFTSVYESMAEVEASDVRIKQLTYNGIYKMFQTQGNFIILWGGYYDETMKANIKKVNDLANTYGITVYNFDPILDAKVGLDSAEGAYNTASADLTDSNIGNVSSNMAKLSAKLLEVMNTQRFPAQGSLMYVIGAPYEVGVDMANQSTFKVTYKGQIKRQSNNIDRLESIIQDACMKMPNYLQYKNDDGTFSSEAFNSVTINQFNVYNDYRFHMAGDDTTGTDAFIEEDASVFVTTTYHALLDLLKNNKGTFALFTGGAWCHNTQAVAKYTSDLAKEYGMDKVYIYDNRLDNGVTEDYFEIVDEVIEGEYKLDSATGALVPATQKGVKVYRNSKANGSVGYLASLDTRSDEDSSLGGMSYSHLYARLIDECLPTYKSMHNEGTLTIKGKSESGYTQMCVPGVMLFDGSKENQAEKLIGIVEAEYEWGYEPYQTAWTDALKELFNKNPYASYNPPIATEGEESGSTDGSASESGSQSSGSSTTLPPAGGSC
jgi:hypothetical protein